ncbi:MAG: TonB-dependent receptor [Opitutaceae bacterium]|jgi:outer membrane receptor protein involved in Fe transport
MNTKQTYKWGSSVSASILHRLLLAGACFSLATMASAQAAAPAPAAAPETDQETIVLPSFTVNTDKDKGYQATNSVSATRTNTPIADLPFSVSALTSQFIQDTAPNDLTDIARYAAGVTSASKEFNAGADSFTIRGFTQSPERNGFNETSFGNSYVDTANIERVEVVKGPAALLYGQVSPGGTVNYITKQPENDPFITVSSTYGSDAYYRETLDLNLPVTDKTLLFRFNGAYTHGMQFEDDTNKSITEVFDPTLTWKVSKTLTLKADFQSFYRYEDPAAVYPPNMDVATAKSVVSSFGNAAPSTAAAFGSAPSAALTSLEGIDAATFNSLGNPYNDAADVGFRGPYPQLPRNFNYDNASDYRRTSLQSADFEADATLNDHWVSRANFDYNVNKSTFNQTGVGDVFLAPPGSLQLVGGVWSQTPAWTALSSAQQAAQAYAFAQALQNNATSALTGYNLPAVIARRPRVQQGYGGAYSIQPELAGTYDLSWVKLKPLVGAFFDKNWETNLIRQNSGSAASPYYPTWDVNPNSPTYYINQRPNPISPSNYTVLAGDTLQTASDQAIYGYLTSTFLKDRVILDGGARYNRSESQSTQFFNASGAIGTGVGQGFRGHATTPEVGIGFKVTRDSLLYADFSESYTFAGGSTQVGTNNAGGINVITGQQAPTTGEGEEIGYKSEFLNGKIASTIAIYRIVQSDVVQSVNQIGSGGTTLTTTTQGADVTSKGIEYEFTVSPIDNLQVTGSIALDDVRNTSEPLGDQIYLGVHPQYTSHTLGNLWARYNFANPRIIKGLWVGAGFNYVGATQGNLADPYLVYPSYWLFNSALGYDGSFGKLHYSAVVNWDNMTNKFYQPADQEVGLPDRILFTLTLHF